MAAKDTDLNEILFALQDFLKIYEQMKNGARYATLEIMKNVQSSIKEICTQIITITSN